MLNKVHSILSFHFLALCVVLALAFVARTHNFDAPLADWHSWRQADTASVSLEYILGRSSDNGVTTIATDGQGDYEYVLSNLGRIFEPQFHDLSNIPSGQENPDGHRMVEFPILNYKVALLTSLIPNGDPTQDVVWVYRLLQAFLSVATIAMVYYILYLVSKRKNIALLSAVIMAAMPYSIFYSRTILPEIGLTFFSYASLATFLLWIQSYRNAHSQAKQTAWLLLTWLLLALAFLLKPVAIFMAPAFATIALWQFGVFGILKTWQIWMLATSVLPVIGWRMHIQEFPAGIPANRWLLNGNGIRLKPSWWKWLFGERIGFHMLGYWATGFAALGVLARIKHTSSIIHSKSLSLFDWLTLSLTAGWFLYLVVFATGNVQHDYYQIPLIPVLSILIARGVSWIYETTTMYQSKFLIAPVLAGILMLSAFLSWSHIRSYYGINNPAIIEAGTYVHQNTPLDAKIIAPYMGDTAFLFQTKRRGWPIGHEIDHKIELGATHYVSTSYDDEARELESRFTVLQKTDSFILIDLTQVNENQTVEIYTN